MTTVKQEIDRLYLESKTKNYITSNEAPYYFDLCSVEDKSISLDQFYKKFPYHNPDYNSEYWKQQYNRWKELWKQETI
jgi:hypothetical protein